MVEIDNLDMVFIIFNRQLVLDFKKSSGHGYGGSGTCLKYSDQTSIQCFKMDRKN